MWTDIALDNRLALLSALEGFQAELGRLRSAVLEGDGEQLRRLMLSAQDWAVEA
jgi:prephenate dehydrogenase